MLIGGADSFRQLAELLRSGGHTAIPVDQLRGRAALQPIDAVDLKPGDGPATIGISANTATLTGGAASLVQLAEAIDLFLEHNDLDEPGIHVHIDAAPASGERLLASGSRDLVLAGPIPDDLQ